MLHLTYHAPVFCQRWTSSSFTEVCALNIHWPQSSRGIPGSRLQSCVLWQGYISATPKEGIRLVEVMDVWARLCTISQINDSLMVWEISKLHRQATHFSCFFLLSFGPSSCGKLTEVRLVLEKRGETTKPQERFRISTIFSRRYAGCHEILDCTVFLGSGDQVWSGVFAHYKSELKIRLKILINHSNILIVLWIASFWHKIILWFDSGWPTQVLEFT